MTTTNYRNLKIVSSEIKLVSLNSNYNKDILENNIGNVRDFFIPFESEKEVENWVESNFELMDKGEKIELVLLNQEDEFIGMLSIRDIKTSPIFGLWIKSSKQKQGYAKKAMKLFMNWLFENTELTELKYTADKNNLASINLVKTLKAEYIRDFLDDSVLTSEFIFRKRK